MKIQSINDPAFLKYGKVLTGYDLDGLIAAMDSFEIPDDVVYVASSPELERLPVFQELQNRGFGGVPIQVGYCNGHNKKLNALEYHRCSEINVACTDMILLLGAQQDIDLDNYTYDTQKVEAFLVPKGAAIEVYATTLHYAPCHVSGEGFRSAASAAQAASRISHWARLQQRRRKKTYSSPAFIVVSTGTVCPLSSR